MTTKVKVPNLIGHPAFKGDENPVVEIIDVYLFYKGKPLQLSATGRKCLRFDIKNA